MSNSAENVFFNLANFSIEHDDRGRRIVSPKNKQQFHELSDLQREAWILFRNLDNNLAEEIRDRAFDNPTIEQYRLRVATVFHNYNDIINRIQVDEFLLQLDSIDDRACESNKWGSWAEMFACIIGVTLGDKQEFVKDYKSKRK